MLHFLKTAKTMSGRRGEGRETTIKIEGGADKDGSERRSPRHSSGRVLGGNQCEGEKSER